MSVRPKFTWDSFPQQFLKDILQYLNARDLSSAVKVNKYWNSVSKTDELWHPLFESEYLWWSPEPKIFLSFFEEFAYFKRCIPKRLETTVDDFGYLLNLCVFSKNGKYLAVCGDQAHFCIYSTSPIEFIDERCLGESLHWSCIEKAEFSPNEDKILLSGIKNEGGGEVAVYSICDTTLEVHFICRISTAPSTFHGCWFDNDHLIIGEYYEFNFHSPLASSISQLYLCTLPPHRNAPSDFYPLLRFLNRAGSVGCPVITATVSPRFRRVVQLGNQAKQEGKSLADKIAELDLQNEVNLEGDIRELREVLDKEQQCFRCYLKHQLTEEEYGGAIVCSCVCHEVFHRLLIYVVGEFKQRLCFKLIDSELVGDALNMRRFKNTNASEEEEGDQWSYIMRRVDQPDHHIDFGGTIDTITLSPDQKQLFVCLETVNRNHENEVIGIVHELRVIDLDKMIIDPIGCCGAMKPTGRGYASAGSRLVASFTTREAILWSTHHRGLAVGRIPFETDVTCVAVHPTENYLAVTSGMELTVWQK